jgi:hypothetical protein
MQKFKTFTEQVELQEGVNDPAIFKAVFLAGGPGSGKSFIAGKTGLGSFGFRNFVVRQQRLLPRRKRSILKVGWVLLLMVLVKTLTS